MSSAVIARLRMTNKKRMSKEDKQTYSFIQLACKEYDELEKRNKEMQEEIEFLRALCRIGFQT